MCFVLYAGTVKPLPRSAFNPEAPAVWVTSVTEHDAAIRAHISKPEMQYIGSTSLCGCDFPHAILQKRRLARNQGRHAFEPDPGENPSRTIELYGLWDGDFSETPKARKTIPLGRILDPDFLFKERGFYMVEIRG
jgi:hypothetical protein